MKSLSTILVVGTLAVVGACGGPSNPLCTPVNAWHAPAHRCAVAASEPVEEVIPEPVAEVEEKPEPLVRVSDDRIEISQKVQFETGSAEIRTVSFSLLDEVAQTLKDNPAIARVRVEGHTDTKGGAALNRRLSKDRAKSVMRYLIEQGVESSRLQSEGYGPSQPISDNESDEGREKNRRVEFKILGGE